MGAILTGGRSTRMGEDKSNVVVAGKPMLDSVVEALRVAVDSFVLLGPDRPGYVCWPDAVHVGGPLAGIATALSRSTDDQVMVVAVDQPFLRHETVIPLIGHAGQVPVVPVDDHGVRQVTCALYPTAIAKQAVEEAEAGGSIQTLLDRVSFLPITAVTYRAWGEDGRSWFSVDTPEAAVEAEASFST